jgi:hypothetical protein
LVGFHCFIVTDEGHSKSHDTNTPSNRAKEQIQAKENIPKII